MVVKQVSYQVSVVEGSPVETVDGPLSHRPVQVKASYELTFHQAPKAPAKAVIKTISKPAAKNAADSKGQKPQSRSKRANALDQPVTNPKGSKDAEKAVKAKAKASSSAVKDKKSKK